MTTTVGDVIDYLNQWPKSFVAKVLVIDNDGTRHEADFDNILYEKGEVKIVGFDLKSKKPDSKRNNAEDLYGPE